MNEKKQLLTIKSDFIENHRRYYICDCACGNTNIKVRADQYNSGVTWHCGCQKVIKEPNLTRQLLTIKGYTKGKNNKTYYICDCACGNTGIMVRSDNYKSGVTWHCGCQKIGIQKYINKKFGRLTVESIDHKTDHGEYVYKCKCDCGNTILVRQTELRAGKTKSCGCLKKEIAAEISHKYCKTHGDKGTKFYQAWAAMRDRCNNSNNKHYDNYGGRGIKVCPEWDRSDGYPKFKEDMYESYLSAIQYYGLEGQEHKLSIDRIDVNKGYYKENCRWVTMKEQANNKTNNHYIEYYGKMTVSELCDKYDIKNRLGIDYSQMVNRLNDGWDLNDAINIPNLKHVHCSSLNDYYNKFGKPLIKPIRFIDDNK